MLCIFRIILVVLVIGLFARVFDCDYEDKDDDDRSIALSTQPGTLAALANPSVISPGVILVPRRLCL